MEVKFCFKCKNNKKLEKFNISKQSKDGYQSNCKDCKQEFYNKNKKEIIQKAKSYYLNNKVNHKKYSKEYRIKKQKEGLYFSGVKGKWITKKPKLTKEESKIVEAYRVRIK